MMVVMFVLLIVVVVMMLMLLIMVVMMFVLVVIIVVVVILIVMAFQFFNPGGAGGNLLVVEETGIQQFVELHVAVVAGNDLCLRLDASDNLPNALQFVGLHIVGFVQQDDVAELYLLDDEVLDVLLVDILCREVCAAVEFVLQAEGIHYGDDAVEVGHTVLRHLGSHAGHRADGLCDGFGLADTAGLNDDVVELLHGNDVVQLLYQIHLEGAADATVLQGDEAVVLSAHDAAFLDEVGVNVHFANIVDDNGETNAAAVGEDAIQEGGFAAAQITREQQNGNVVFSHGVCCFVMFMQSYNI